MDDTLQNGAWRDSFDQLIEPEKPILRKLNLLKKNVRRSFNMDSSVENSDYSATASPLLPIPNGHINVPVPHVHGCALKRVGGSISTPLTEKHLFCCPISPIVDLHNSIEAHEDPMQCPPKENIQVNEINCVDFGQNRLLQGQPLIKKRVCFDVDTDFLISEKDTRKRSSTETCQSKKVTRDSQFTLQPGKWRKSLSNWRRRTQHYLQQCNKEFRPNVLINENQIQSSDTRSFEDSVKFVCVTHLVGKRKSIFIKPERSSQPGNVSFSAMGNSCKRDVMKRCGQRKPLAFEKAYSRKQMTQCRKIGEGVYGEVFINKGINLMEETVLKIIPIEGLAEVNGEVQKTFEQILPEIIISSELSALRNNKSTSENSTYGFIELKKTKLVEGKYPDHLIRLWEEFNEEKTSDNDHPGLFDDTQLYIVLELQFAGVDLATFEFVNAEQSYYAFLQILLTLAIGEEAFQFEHRDLHWGNVLILKTDDKNIDFKIKNKLVTVPSKGIKVTIIDYTLSRITFNDVCLYNDLSNDEELFAATGDYQYDIYRMMRDVLKNNWQSFEPKTNVYWLSYIIHKMMDGVQYKNVHTKTHQTYLSKFNNLTKTIMNSESAIDCAKYLKKIT